MRILTIILLLSYQSIQAQSYTIIHVIGKIYDRSTNTYLKSGVKLAERSKLKFETPNARAAALSSSRGRYVIQQQNTADDGSDLVYTLSSVLAPARGKMSTRAGGINNQMDFLKKFGEGPVALINGRYEVPISSISYPTDEIRFFYGSYQFNKESINKRLEVANDKLIFDTKSFYTIDGIPVDPMETSDARLFYYDSDKQESLEITTLDFAIVSPEDFDSIKSSLADMSLDEQLSAMQDILTSMYGKCDAEQIRTATKNTK